MTEMSLVDGGDGRDEVVFTTDSPTASEADRPSARDDDSAGRETSRADDLRFEVTRFHERSAAQEDIIGRMQARIEELQADQVRALLAPVANELAVLHGDLGQLAGNDPASVTPARLATEVGLLRSRVESALEHLGMELVPVAPGEAFDRRWHAAVRRLPTADASLDLTIASVARDGFAQVGSERATVPARVVIHVLDASTTAPHGPPPAREPASDTPANQEI